MLFHWQKQNNVSDPLPANVMKQFAVAQYHLLSITWHISVIHHFTEEIEAHGEEGLNF